MPSIKTILKTAAIAVAAMAVVNRVSAARTFVNNG